MNRTLLITRPNYDLATRYLFYWGDLVITEARKKRIAVLDLSDKKATKEDLHSYIEKNEPALIFFNGHGSSNAITGQDGNVLVQTNDNEHILSGKIIYARSCDAVRELGSSSVKKGAVAFVGYNRKYIFGYSQESVTRPLNDEVARLFLEPSNSVPISLLKGRTIEEAYTKSQDLMKRNVRYMASSKASQIQRDSVPYLWSNMKYQTIVGDEKSKF